jgi:SagB-type dehydrogenase family enzyme
MDSKQIASQRDFLKDSMRLAIDFRFTDQRMGVEPPPIQKPVQPEQQVFKLPPPDNRYSVSLFDAIAGRTSRRRFSTVPLDLTELAFLLWATQGIRAEPAPGTALRTVPSAGCRHPFETYLLVNHVTRLEAGVYRYLPREHALVLERVDADLIEKLPPSTLGQMFTAAAAVTFVWTCIPYRTEWRYHTAAHRVILMDVGHVCQNLYLACAAIDSGTCAIAAFHQELMDELVGVDGVDEFVIYLAPVGKI